MAEIVLFDIEGGMAKPTKHCYTILPLKKIMDEFPTIYTSIFTYIQYMTSLDGKENPYIDYPEDIKEETIIKDVNPEIDPLHPDIRIALKTVEEIYRTNPHYRAFMAAKKNFDKFCSFLEREEWTTGKEGSSTQLIAANKAFPDMKAAYDTAEKDYLKTVLKRKTWAGQEDTFSKKEVGDED